MPKEMEMVEELGAGRDGHLAPMVSGEFE